MYYKAAPDGLLFVFEPLFKEAFFPYHD
jgi:hypothetical protein